MNNLDIKKIRSKLNISQEELAERLGVHMRTVQNWESGKVIPKSKYTILHDIMKNQNKEVNPKDEISVYSVPLLPISAQGGSLDEFFVSVKNSDCEKIISPIKGADFAITVAGDSMAPEYPNGAQVLIKKINEKAFIDWGKVFVLDTCNGTIIKIIVPSDKNGCIRCVSINSESRFAPYDICLADIFGIYRVMLCISIK